MQYFMIIDYVAHKGFNPSPKMRKCPRHIYLSYPGYVLKGWPLLLWSSLLPLAKIYTHRPTCHLSSMFVSVYEYVCRSKTARSLTRSVVRNMNWFDNVQINNEFDLCRIKKGFDVSSIYFCFISMFKLFSVIWKKKILLLHNFLANDSKIL